MVKHRFNKNGEVDIENYPEPQLEERKSDPKPEPPEASKTIRKSKIKQKEKKEYLN